MQRINILSFTTPDDMVLSLNPNHIVCIAPDKQIGLSIITFIGGQARVAVPYTQAIRLWAAALDGKPVLDA